MSIEQCGCPRKEFEGRFGSFVSSYRVENLATELDVDPASVYGWMRDDSGLVLVDLDSRDLDSRGRVDEALQIVDGCRSAKGDQNWQDCLVGCEAAENVMEKRRLAPTRTRIDIDRTLAAAKEQSRSILLDFSAAPA